MGLAGPSDVSEGEAELDSDGAWDVLAVDVEDADPGDVDEPVDPEAVDESLPSVAELPLSPALVEPAALPGASPADSLARSEAWPGRAGRPGSPGRSGRPGRSVELASAKPPEVRATTAPVATTARTAARLPRREGET
jgi:hypothetical protein